MHACSVDRNKAKAKSGSQKKTKEELGLDRLEGFNEERLMRRVWKANH